MICLSLRFPQPTWKLFNQLISVQTKLTRQRIHKNFNILSNYAWKNYVLDSRCMCQNLSKSMLPTAVSWSQSSINCSVESSALNKIVARWWFRSHRDVQRNYSDLRVGVDWVQRHRGPGEVTERTVGLGDEGRGNSAVVWCAEHKWVAEANTRNWDGNQVRECPIWVLQSLVRGQSTHLPALVRFGLRTEKK